MADVETRVRDALREMAAQVERRRVIDVPAPPSSFPRTPRSPAPRRRVGLVASAAAALVVALVAGLLQVARTADRHGATSEPSATTVALSPTTQRAPKPSLAPTVSTQVPNTDAPSTSVAPADECALVPLAPTVLPDGSVPGSPVRIEVDGVQSVRWDGEDDKLAVTQLLDVDVDVSRFDIAQRSSVNVTVGAVFDAAVHVRSGNPPNTVITIDTLEHSTGCLREYVVGPGLTTAEVNSFVGDWQYAAADARPDVAPTDGSTLLAIHHGSPFMYPQNTVAPLDGFDPSLVAMSPGGVIVAGRRESDRVHLSRLGPDRTWIDLGVEVDFAPSADVRLVFGPLDDLFVFAYWESGTEGHAVVTQVRVNGDPAQRIVDRAVGTFTTGQCAFSVEPDHVGCTVGRGPAITFMPPVDFDRVVVDPGLRSIERAGPTGRRSWTLKSGGALRLGCLDGGCLTQTALGSAGMAIWAPHNDELRAQSNRVVYILGDEPIAIAMWIAPSTGIVLGVDGQQLLTTYESNATWTIEAFDLAPLLDP